MTLDADIALPPDLSVKGQNVRERLLAHGFSEHRFGEDNLHVTHYHPLDSRSGFFAEFLTPLKGGEHHRSRVRKTTRRIAGVASRQLTCLEILLLAPWSVDLDEPKGFPLAGRETVRVANPSAFLAHTVLVYAKRRRAGFAKDLLYIYDTLESFGARLVDLRREWQVQVRPRLHRRTALTVELGANTLFGEVNDSVRSAARMAGDRKRTPEAIREACGFGLDEVFG